MPEPYRPLTLPNTTDHEDDWECMVTEQDLTFSEDSNSSSDSHYSHPEYSPIQSPVGNEEHRADDMDDSMDVDPQLEVRQISTVVLIANTICIHFCLFQNPTETVLSPQQSWIGFKFVGDNIDKRVKPRFQRSEIRGHDGHYFHGFAVKDRIDLSALSEEKPPRVEPQSSQLLPSNEDISAYKKDLEILISRYV